MTMEQAEKSKINPFDVTKVWPHSEYPLIPVGRMVLNRNPANYFAEVEQIAFAPSHLIPGIKKTLNRVQIKKKKNFNALFFLIRRRDFSR